MSKAAKQVETVEAGEDGVAVISQAEHNATVASVLTTLVDKVSSMSPAVKAAVVHGDGKDFLVNTDGKTLMAKFNLAKRAGAPDPLCITINDEFFWMKRGIDVEVPFYLVLHMKNNIETHYLQEKDERGKNVIVTEKRPAEAFSYVWINPDQNQVNAKYL